MSFGKYGISRRQSLAFGATLLFALGFHAGNGFSQGFTGAVYAMTNNTAGNAIVAFNRDTAGNLSMIGTFATGGLGFGTGNDPLGSQGSLLLTSDGHFLLAANAGSNNISVMQANRLGLKPVGIFPSGGIEPVSLAIYRDLVYVLNAGGTPNITGFELNSDGTLRMLAGSSRPLAGGTAAGPAQVGFTPDGSFLAVTEKDTNLIDTYRVLASGLTAGPISNRSNGTEPFGFVFAASGALVVTEAAGGSGGTSAASSYQISRHSGELSLISPSVGDTQAGTCWAAATNDGRFVYVSNTASSTLSSYAVGAGGGLTLLNAVAGMTGSGSVPLDSTLTANGEFLYVLNEGTGTVGGFRIESDGSLTTLAGAGGLPITAQGIAAE
jgi:6-phosphogluconolactonase